MTVVAGFRFADAVVLLADTRASWFVSRAFLCQDNLLKVVALGKRALIGYSSDNVRYGWKLLAGLRAAVARRRRYEAPTELVLYAERLGRYLWSKPPQRNCSLHLLLAGATRSGEMYLWRLESPGFSPSRVDEWAVIGSGSHALRNSSPEWSSLGLLSLKDRTGRLILWLEDGLRKHRDADCSSLFQVVALGPQGSHPYAYRSVKFDPNAQPFSRSMDYRQGRWVAQDLSRGIEVALVEPGAFAESKPVIRFDWDEEPSSSRFHLTRFIVCEKVCIDQGTLRFEGFGFVADIDEYPAKLRFEVYVGLWGTPGQHELALHAVSGSQRVELARNQIRVDHIPGEVSVNLPVCLGVAKPGKVFLECSVGTELLGRYGLVLRQASSTSDQEAELDQGLPETGDDRTGPPTVVYLVVCQRTEHTESSLIFQTPLRALYVRSYPHCVGAHVALAFRAPKRKHRLAVNLVSVVAQTTIELASADVGVPSSLVISRWHFDAVLPFAMPGPYYVRALLDGFPFATVIVTAETDRPQYYDPGPEVRRRVADGELWFS